MAFVRIPSSQQDAFDLDALKMHARIDDDYEDAALTLMGRTAVSEIEAYCDIALIRQVIVLDEVSYDRSQDRRIVLPVGPLATDSVVTINDSLYTGPITGGRYPVLTLPEQITGPVSISYEAGYGTDPTAIPSDLQFAILDHASRLYDVRGADEKQLQGLSLAAARICARHRRVRV